VPSDNLNLLQINFSTEVWFQLALPSIYELFASDNKYFIVTSPSTLELVRRPTTKDIFKSKYTVSAEEFPSLTFVLYRNISLVE
jgi:hypothetical protein